MEAKAKLSERTKEIKKRRSGEVVDKDEREKRKKSERDETKGNERERDGVVDAELYLFFYLLLPTSLLDDL